MHAVLLLFEEMSRLKVNFHKSMLTGVNINETWLAEASLVMNCRRRSYPFVYLGIPIGGDSKKLSFWKPVIDRIVARLSMWNNKFLSFGGHMILLKSVLSSLPVYFLSFFKAPAGIISSIESIFKSFFLGGSEDSRKIAWIKWDSVCIPKEDGGLGVRRLAEFNLSLLGKWCWRMLVDKEGLWYRVLKARYSEEGGRLKEGGSHGSLWWRRLCEVRCGVGLGVGNWFDSNIFGVVGDGRDTFFWLDHWVGESPLRFKFPRLFDLALNKECKVEEMEREGWGEGGGAWSWRRRLFAWEEASLRECSLLLHNIVLQDSVTDKWRWLLNPIHGYSVRDTYRFITNDGVQIDRSLVNDVWHRFIPAKVSLFVWRLLRNRLPTRDNLVRRNILQPPLSLCPFGCNEPESARHLFLECTTSNFLWSQVTSWLGISMVFPLDLRDHLYQFSHMAGLPQYINSFLTGIWFACV